MDRLATLALEHDLGTPLGELIDSRFLSDVVRTGLRAWLGSDAAEAWLLVRITELHAWLRSRGGTTLGELVPTELQEACTELAGRRYTPSREVTLFLLDREPVRALLRNLLADELLAFGRKLRAPVVENPLARGLGGLGKMARERAKASRGAFAAMATEVVGAVSDELERQLDRKASDFADAALSRVMHRLADLLCDPASAGDQARLRQALVDGIFELEAAEIAEELERSEPRVVSEIVRRSLSSWVDRDDAADELAEVIDAIFAPDAAHPLRDVLERLGLLESFMELGHDTMLRRMRELVESPAFTAWLEILVGPSSAPRKPKTPKSAAKKSPTTKPSSSR